MSNSFQFHILQRSRLLCPWGSPSKDAGMDCHVLLQGDLPDLGIKPKFPVAPALQVDSLPLGHGKSPIYIYIRLVANINRLTLQQLLCTLISFVLYTLFPLLSLSLSLPYYIDCFTLQEISSYFTSNMSKSQPRIEELAKLWIPFDSLREKGEVSKG